MEKLTTNRGFWLAFLLSIVTLGFYSWYLIYAFAKETNIACKDDGKSTSGLLVYILLSIITLGIYSIVWYYKATFFHHKIFPFQNKLIASHLLMLYFLF